MSWILTHVYDATKDKTYLVNAVKILKSEIESNVKLELFHRVAEQYWNLAKIEEQLENYSNSSNSFEEASKYYVKAGEKYPGIGQFYYEYSQYMSAWSLFEAAKQAHFDKDYLRAKENFEDVVSKIESTKRWSHQAPNFLAWSKLEEAEAHSRSEKPKEAIVSFNEAVDLFAKSKESSQARLKEIIAVENENQDIIKTIAEEAVKKDELPALKPSSSKDTEEKENLLKLIEAADVRSDYCRGRIALEEALIHIKNGETRQSSRKYGEAANVFNEIGKKSEENRVEIQPFVCLSQAWQYLMQAEADSKPEKYQEATKQFEEMKDHCTDDKSKRLIHGHTFFCKALEAGALFEERKDPALLSEAIKNFGYAADDYLKGNYLQASEYARANQRLFEGYGYMENASKETDPAKKAQLYALAEKLLGSSAQSYQRAEYTEKALEVNRILSRVREEREVAVSLSDIIKSPSMVVPTGAFPVPMPTVESAVGLDKFETAEIQAALGFKKDRYRIGEQIDYELEIYNTGKGAANLLKVEDAVNESFKVKSKPPWVRFDRSHMNVLQRTLKPHIMEDIHLVIVPSSEGDYLFQPKIVYSDDSNQVSTYRVDGRVVSVKELGISDWLKGPEKKGL